MSVLYKKMRYGRIFSVPAFDEFFVLLPQSLLRVLSGYRVVGPSTHTYSKSVTPRVTHKRRGNLHRYGQLHAQISHCL